MKTKIISAIFLFFILSSVAHAQSATLTVFSEDGEKFWVILNGAKQNQNPLVKVVVPNQTEEFQKLRIIFEDEKLETLNQSIQFTDFDKNWNDVTYAIRKNNKGKNVLRIVSWNPSSPSTATTKTQTQNTNQSTEIVTEQQTGTAMPKSTVTTKTTTTGTTKPASVGTNINVNDPNTGVNFSMNVNMNDMPGMSTTTQMEQTTSTTDFDNDEAVKPAARPAAKPVAKPASRPAAPEKKAAESCTLAMSTADFEDAKKSVSSKSFEDTKFQSAKLVVKNNCLNTTQVKEMIKLFSFEQTKIDFAKFAYDKTVDKNNYYKVGDAFGFSSSTDELNSFLETK